MGFLKGTSTQDFSLSDKTETSEVQSQSVLFGEKAAGLRGAHAEPAQEVQITIKDV